MARLKIRLRGKVVSEIPLSEERQYMGGRKDDCDILLQAEKGISREHFRLSAQNGVWNLETLSRFGEVIVGGEKVSQLSLEHGMLFAVPPYEFEFLLTSGDAPSISESSPASVESGGDGPAQDGYAVPPQAAHEAEEPMVEKTVVGVAPSVPYIKVMDSQGEPRELIRLEGGDSWVAGRESTCNIHIKDQRVSRRQFEIRKAGSTYSILDLGSVNGTLLNGNPISTADLTPLKSGDAISVLENYFYFELHDPNFKSRLEMVNLQPAPEPQGLVNPLVPIGGDQELPSGYDAPAYPGGMPPVPYGGEGYHPPAMYQQGEWGGNLPAHYDPNMHQGYYQQPAPAQNLPTGKFDFQKHRPKILIGVIALVVLVFALSGEDNSLPAPHANSLTVDPLAKLSPEQKKLVKDTLQLAKSYYMQGKYEFAKSEIVKMTEFAPEFEDSRELMRLIEEALYVQQQQKKQEEIEKNRAEQEEKIRRKHAQCSQILNASTTRDMMENCLSDVIALNPAHPLFAELFGKIEGMTAARQAEEARLAAHQDLVAQLKKSYAYAKSLERKNQPLAAIKAHERVAASQLPDPGGLRGASRTRIEELRHSVNSRTAQQQAAADKFASEGKLKDAILALRRAKQVDPTNAMIDEKISDLRFKLQENMMTIYQEGILEESFGNVDGDESKPGAKQKWKLILKSDVPDGEYYKKALIKLKKYGSNL
jgi:pSer/pThr/pTyr-binding forkhead associated (FHA) protein